VGINKISTDWLFELNQRHRIFEDALVVDLGPQDFASPLVKASFSPPFGAGDWSENLYRRVGASSYKSYDLYDSRSEKCDFNNPPQGSGNADVVTNFGTSEHVANQMAIMRFAHELTQDDGVMLHIVPCSWGRDHGYFNYHPEFFRDLALANEYEVLSLLIVPLVDIQERTGKLRLAVDARVRSTVRPQLRRGYARSLVSFAVLRALVAAACSNLSKRRSPFHSMQTGDCLFVALRKTGKAQKFTLPVQTRYERKYAAAAKNGSI